MTTTANAPAPSPNAPAPAPEAQPQGTPTPAPSPPPAPIEDKPTPVSFEETGNVVLDTGLNLLADGGIGPDNKALRHAAETGDFSALEALVADKKLKSGKQALALLKTAYEQETAKAKEAQAATEKVVHDVVGGAEQWKAIHAWAKANADDGERAQFNAMFEAGGFQAQAAARELARLYEIAGNAKKDPARVTRDGGKPGEKSGEQPAKVGGPLGPREFASELAKLVKQYGAHGAQRRAEYRELHQRRAAYRG